MPRMYLIVSLPLYVYIMKKVDGKIYSEYGYPFNLAHVGTPEEILLAELYPRTKIEEKNFFINSFMGVWGAMFFWFVIFGAIVFMFGLRAI